MFKVFSNDGDTEQIKKMTSISKTDSKSLAVVVALLEVDQKSCDMTHSVTVKLCLSTRVFLLKKTK